ncbi:hypothetical protein EJ04DRAFT_610126 [Polyplosphaeria fusca]|uniref:feruloyl esterase n=1 Tax=Polyplosphaeria fusca TaxID=682080 RepID=A0A9P4V062_9PLEO|nr:hypothetical protein EJ04DRAFT_610126 [Polyplosphaeria fusca]
MPELINDTASIIYVAPNGRNQGWANADGQDMTFIQQVVKVTSNELCIDETLRFNIGFSYGDAMLYSIACTLAKDFRALAALSGGQLSQCMGGNDSIAYYHQHGINDQVLPIAGARQMRDRFVKTWCKG